MKTSAALLLALLAGKFVNAQKNHVLYGFVMEQNSGKKPVRGAFIKASFANSIQTIDNGSYTLNFQNAKPGRSVSLTVEKQGWVITDPERLQVNLPEDPYRHPHTIIVCREDVWRRNSEENRKSVEQNLRTSFEREKARLMKQNKDYRKVLDSLEQQYDRLGKAMLEFADAMTRTNLDEITEEERRAYELFKAGKMDESIRLREKLYDEKVGLEMVNDKRKIERAGKALDSVREKKEQQIQAFVRNAKELANEKELQFDFARVDSILAYLATEFDSTSSDRLFEYAVFLQSQNRFDTAIAFYRKAERYAGEAGISSIKSNLGMLYKAKNDYAAAETVYKEALEVYLRLAMSNPVAYEPNVATTQNNLGVLYNNKKDYAAAETAYKKALEIFLHLAERNPAVYESNVATTQNNLGVLYRGKKEYAAAEAVYKDALEINRRLAKNNPSIHEAGVAMALNNLGIVYDDKEDFAAAEAAYKEALEIYLRLVNTNPTVYEPGLASTLHNLGALGTKDYAANEAAYKEALKIRKRLAKSNPAVYESAVAETQHNLGILYTDRKDYATAEIPFKEALEIRRRLAKNTPDVYELDLAQTLANYGVVLFLQDDARAEQLFSEALGIYKRLVGRGFTAYTQKVTALQAALDKINSTKK